MATHPYLESSRPIGIAHRGGAAEEPENTIEAFRAASALGFRYLETDVHLTIDGVVAAFHDPTLDRVSDRSGSIAELPWSEVRGARVEGRGTIPSMQELLEEFPDARFNIDAKSDAVLVPLLDLMVELDVLDRVCLGSFSDRRLARARARLGARLCTSAGRAGIARHVARARGVRVPPDKAHALQVPPSVRGIRLVTRRFVDRAHADGRAVHVWTIDDEDQMHELFDLGVDGIMTDRPQALRSVMIERGLWS